MKHKIIVHAGKREETIFANDGETLFSALVSHGFFVDASCGGFGTCGKCKVYAMGDFRSPIGKISQKREILSCEAYPLGDVSVYLPRLPQKRPHVIRRTIKCDGESLGIAFDVGTTGISAALYDMKSGILLSELCEDNPQIPYGADVMTRISHDEKRGELVRLLREKLGAMITKLHAKKSEISYIVISANTAMLHYIADLPLSGLASAPFEPEELFGREFSPSQLGIPCKNAKVFLIPCLSAFVGGDISSGILACGMAEKKKLSLLVDIGTNGEIALGNRDGILVASAAAGPAFEGAALACGMAAREGAIFSYEGGQYKTVGNKKPCGICGSGALDIVSELLTLGVITPEGRLLPKDEAPILREKLCERNGEVCFMLSDTVFLSAGDVRKIQLAKAAIRAGISTLLREKGLCEADVDTLFLSGAFGTHIRKESATNIGLIPKELLLRSVPCGNSSLEGASLALLSKAARKKLSAISKKALHCELAENPIFEEEFVSNINM